MADTPTPPEGDPDADNHDSERHALTTEIEAALLKTGVVPEHSAPKAARVAARVTMASFAGPLPPPEMLRAYEEICPGAASRIIQLAENEQTHRHFWENGALWNDVYVQSGGLTLGFILAVFFVIAAIYAAQQNMPKISYILLGTTFVSTIPTFVDAFRRSKSRKAPTEDVPVVQKLPGSKKGGQKRR
jgi:uncharacterized membrane protein